MTTSNKIRIHDAPAGSGRRRGKAAPAWLVLLLLTAISASCGWGLYSLSQGSASVFLTRLAFEYFLAGESKELQEQSSSGLSSTYYFTSYYLNGLLSAAEGTGSDRILERAIRAMDTMVSTAHDFQENGRTYKAWKPFFITPDSTLAHPSLHYTFQASVPLARAAAIIMARPEWRTRYAAAARRYTAFVDATVIQYWCRSQLHGDIPWVNPDHFPIWNDNGANLGLITAFLYQATGDRRYADMARRIGRAFESKIKPAGRGWIWENQTIPIGSDTDNTPGSVGNQAGVPDTSHANREAFLMMALHEAGIMFTQADLERMAATLTDTIWDRSSDSPSFANYLNGSNAPYRVYKEPGLNGSIYHGWALMGGYSPKAQQVLIYLLRASLKGRMNPAIERNITGYGGRLGLCGHMLRNFALLRRQS
ncbi:MAG TPA: hypothetical protein DEB40_06625 [Elusimicrobia bacterium]|nr:hypothetical protein [Elusimicrobiota bacterium]HBT61402.1 hypothetical protein [Elusimicrobiota bacterium]